MRTRGISEEGMKRIASIVGSGGDVVQLFVDKISNWGDKNNLKVEVEDNDGEIQIFLDGEGVIISKKDDGGGILVIQGDRGDKNYDISKNMNVAFKAFVKSISRSLGIDED